jgi:RNA polymerase sigma-70 factor (ECF subfamily)
MNEEKVIDRVLDGDTDLYRQLVDRYQTGLIIHCENILKSREDGEDIAQEAFIKAFRSLSDFSVEKAKFSTWIYRIATNLCIDFLRKNKLKVTIDDVESHMEAFQPSYTDEEEKQFLQKMINELEPPKYGELIKAYFWEGKSYKELAKTYGTSTNTIGTWMSRAKVQLKEKLS